MFFSVALFAVAAVSPQGTVVVAFLSGLGAMTVLLLVGFGKAPFAPPLALPDVACSFCGKSRQAVKHLVAAPRVSICDECTSLTLGVLLEQEAPNWQLVLAALPPRTPRDVSSALINLVATSNEPADLRRFMLDAHRVGNPVAQVALFERIAEDARTSADWINYGVCLGELGRYAEAIAATRRSGGSEAWVLNNVNAFTVQAEPSRREGLQELVDGERRALQAVEAIDEKQRPTVRAAILGTLAEVQQRWVARRGAQVPRRSRDALAWQSRARSDEGEGAG